MKNNPRVGHRSVGAVLVVTVGLLGACSSSDGLADEPASDDSPDVTSTSLAPSSTLAEPAPDDSSDVTSTSSAPPDTVAPDLAAPNATIAPDLPEAFRDVIAPLEVVGDTLSRLEADNFSDDPAVGMPAPVLIGFDYDGNVVRADAKLTGPTMVVFLAHWCSHCNAEIPVLNALRDADRVPQGVDVVAVSTAVNPGQPNFPPGQWLVDKDWTWPVIVDGVDMQRETFIGADAFGVSGFPFVVLVDGEGDVVGRWSGGRSENEFAELLADLAERG